MKKKASSGTKKTGTRTRSVTGGAKAGRRGESVNLWPRRIITGSGLLLIIAVLMWGVVTAIGALFAPTRSHNTPMSQSQPQSQAQSAQSGSVLAASRTSSEYQLKPGEKETKDGILGVDDAVTVPKCSDSRLSISATGVQTTVGAGENLEVSIRNRGGVACVLTPERIGLQVLTGEEQVFHSAQCEDVNVLEHALLLNANTTWEGTMRWDGKVYSSGCTQVGDNSGNAQEGTYRAQIFLDGQSVGREIIFTIIEP